MNKNIRAILLLINIAAFAFQAKIAAAQSPTDMEFVPKGSICAGLAYDHSSWKKYWQVKTLISNGNVGTVTTQSYGVGAWIGVLNRLNFIFMLPYVRTNPSQGWLKGQHGIQDLYLNLKGKYGEWKLGPGSLKVGGDIGFSTPVSHYLIDFAPLNIGSGTTDWSYRQLVSYKLDKGFYVDLKANYTYRSNIPNIHRDFYYDQGNAYYSNEVKVPNILDWAASVGFSNTHVLGEVTYQSFHDYGGSDLRTWDPGFPTNNMSHTTINGRFDYYLSKPKGLYAELTGGYVLTGENIGQSIYAGIAVNYVFHAWGKNEAKDKAVK